MEIESYKGYSVALILGDIADDNVGYFGRIKDINDLITFEGNTLEEFIKNFHEAVDDYIEFCKKVNKEPEINIAIRPYILKDISNQ